ncbi:putative reverse transcriptase domain-containing protein [Tanacetum coccineum]
MYGRVGRGVWFSLLLYAALSGKSCGVARSLGKVVLDGQGLGGIAIRHVVVCFGVCSLGAFLMGGLHYLVSVGVLVLLIVAGKESGCCRYGRGGGRTGGRSGDQVNGRIDGQGGQVGVQGSEVNDGVDRVLDFSTLISQQLRNLPPNIIAKVGDQGRGQGNGRNQNGDAINDNIRGDVRNVIGNNDHRGCTYKEFLACNPKEYDGKGGDVVYTRWIEKMELIQDMSGCGDKQKVKYTDGSFVGMSWDDFKVLMREEFCPSNEMQKMETKLWKHIMVEAGHAAYTDRFHELARGEPSKDRNGRDDNKRTRTINAFATTAYLVRREYMGATPKCTTCNYHHPPETPCRTCFNCNRPRHFARDCRVVHRNVNPINARNPTARACYECGSTDHFTATCPRLNQAQMPRGNHQNQVVAVNRGHGLMCCRVGSIY